MLQLQSQHLLFVAYLALVLVSSGCVCEPKYPTRCGLRCNNVIAENKNINLEE